MHSGRGRSSASDHYCPFPLRFNFHQPYFFSFPRTLPTFFEISFILSYSWQLPASRDLGLPRIISRPALSPSQSENSSGQWNDSRKDPRRLPERARDGREKRTRQCWLTAKANWTTWYSNMENRRAIPSVAIVPSVPEIPVSTGRERERESCERLREERSRVALVNGSKSLPSQ